MLPSQFDLVPTNKIFNVVLYNGRPIVSLAIGAYIQVAVVYTLFFPERFQLRERTQKERPRLNTSVHNTDTERSEPCPE
jgi:hypothetical protein